MMRVLIIGGTGFIGRELVKKLVDKGLDLRVASRHLAGRQAIPAPASVKVEQADVHDDAGLDHLVAGCDAVINLVGILHSRRGEPYGADFDRAHVQLPRRIALACIKHQVHHLIHISALGADPLGPSGYLRSKAAGEAAIATVFANAPQSRSHYTVFRPSVVFGPEDKFMNMFAQLARFLPVLPIAGAASQLQPVFVGDVADAVAGVVLSPSNTHRLFDLAGPRVYTLKELVSQATLWSGRRRWVVSLPNFLGQLQAMLFEALPGEPLMSRDNLASLSVHNVSASPMAPELGVKPRALEDIAPAYLRQPAGL